MAASVEARLDSIFAMGKCRREDVDQRCLDQLKSLPESAGLEVVQKFSEADLSSINSKSGFLMGIIKRFKEQVLAPPSLSSAPQHSRLLRILLGSSSSSTHSSSPEQLNPPPAPSSSHALW